MLSQKHVPITCIMNVTCEHDDCVTIVACVLFSDAFVRYNVRQNILTVFITKLIA